MWLARLRLRPKTQDPRPRCRKAGLSYHILGLAVSELIVNVEEPVSNEPFTHVSVPIDLLAQARRIPE